MQAQESTSEFDIPVRLGVFADNGVHPGLKIGTSFLLKENVRVRTYRAKSGNSRTISINYTGDAQAGFYNHPNNHLGLFIGVGVSRIRKNTKSLFSRAWSFEVNYLRRQYNIETVELDENGELSVVNGAGNHSLMLALSPSISRVFGTKNGGDGVEIYLKPSLQMVKYNHGFFPNAAIEFGIGLYLFNKNSSK